MRKIRLLSLVVITACHLFSQSALTPQGECRRLHPLDAYTIIYPAQHTGQEKTSATILSDYLRKATGVSVPVRQESAHEPTLLFSVGNTRAAAAADIRVLPQEQAYRLAFKQGNLYFCGGSRGPIYAVLAFLEEDLGIRWYNKREAPRIPRLPGSYLLVTPRDFVPPFEIREPLYDDTMKHTRWAAFNRLQNLSYFFSIPPQLGGGLANTRYFIHTYDLLVPAKTYYDTHPEFFPLLGGKRHRSKQRDGQLCYTCSGVADVMAAALRTAIAKQPGSRIYSVSCNDNPNTLCECPGCKELIGRNGVSGAQLHLANEVARRLITDFPNIKLTTLAYVDSQMPPDHCAPAPGICPIYAPIRERAHCNMVLPWKDIPKIMSELKQWDALTKDLYVWDYVNRPHIPFPNFQVIEENLKTWRKHGVTGVFLESAEFNLNSLAPLKSWVFSKLLWNPDWNMRLLIDEFIRGYYGVAAKEMAAYVNLQMAKWNDFYPKRKPGEDICFTVQDQNTMLELLRKAYEKAGEDTALRQKIAEEFASAAVLALRLCTKENQLSYRALLEETERLLSRHKLELGGRLKTAGLLKNWHQQLEDIVKGCSLPLYCEQSLVLKKPECFLKAKIVPDSSARTGFSAKQPSHNDWGVQWNFEPVLAQAPNQQVYVVRMRLKASLSKPHKPTTQGASLHLYRAGISPLQGRYATIGETPASGQYGFVYFFKLYVNSPSVTGYFYNCLGKELDPHESFSYDYIEFIPLERFKDRKLADSLPLVTL